MVKVTHFDVVVRDVKRAIAFYEKAFEWNISKWEGPMDYWLIDPGDPSKPGIGGGISQGEPNFTGGPLTLDVPSVEEVLDRVKAAGGKQTREKDAVPGVGWLAEVEDTEGNRWGLMQEDANAK